MYNIEDQEAATVLHEIGAMSDEKYTEVFLDAMSQAQQEPVLITMAKERLRKK